MRDPRQGFGLTELLVAITILGVGVLGVAGLASSTGDRTRAARQQTDLLIAAQQALEVAARIPFDSLVATVDTTFAPFGLVIDRSVSVLGPSLKQVDLTASDTAAASKLHLTLLVARPAWLP